MPEHQKRSKRGDGEEYRREKRRGARNHVGKGTWWNGNLGDALHISATLYALAFVLEALTVGFFRGVAGSGSRFLFVLRLGLGTPRVGTSPP